MSERVRSKDKHIHGEYYETHESYGLVSFSRVQGRPKSLFGSPIRPLHFISLRLSGGQRNHGLGDSHYFDKELECEVWMTEVQFAEFITTPNRGCGVPCTFRYRRTGDLKRCEDPPEQESPASATRRQFVEQVEDKMASMKAVKRRIGSLLDQSHLPKKRKEEILHEIEQLMRVFEDSAPFAMKRFEENMLAAVATAKTEVSSHARLVAEQTGVQLLKQGEDPSLEIEAEVKP